jgi:hypothetical protein
MSQRGLHKAFLGQIALSKPDEFARSRGVCSPAFFCLRRTSLCLHSSLTSSLACFTFTALTIRQPITQPFMKKQIVSISILQSSKMFTLLYFLMGFLYTLAGIPMIIFGSKLIKIMGLFYLFGPVFAAVFGFIFFVVFAAIYNLLAKWVGGVEVEVKDAGQ